jgi:hypothetical protein
MKETVVAQELKGGACCEDRAGNSFLCKSLVSGALSSSPRDIVSALAAGRNFEWRFWHSGKH